MGRIKENDPIFSFNENYNGVLNHNGTFMVAKTPIKQEILHINGKESIRVKGRRKGYNCKIHKGMLSLLDFVEKGDIGFIKFRNGEAWFVGFQKKKSYNNQMKTEDENCDWQEFLNGVDVE